MANRLAVRALATVFNQAAPGADTNILSTALTPYETASTMRVTVVLAATSVLNYTVTSGATTFTCGLNGSVALNSGDVYSFTFACRSAYTYNFQVETDGVIRQLLVEEIVGGVV